MGFFSKWFSKKKGSSVHECPKKGDICIYVYRVDNEQAVSGVKVSISGTSSGQKPTDGNGYAEFPDRDPGPYEFKIALPKNLAHYKIEPYYQSLSLDAGGHAIVVGSLPSGPLVRATLRGDATQKFAWVYEAGDGRAWSPVATVTWEK